MKTALATPEVLILDVEGEQITLDESSMDFSDLTEDEIQTISKMIERGPLFDQGEPTPIGVAVFIFVKLARGREWGAEHFKAVVPLLTSWLTDELEEV